MTRFILVYICFLLSLPAFATCRPRKGDVLTIGCGYRCDFTYRLRLTFASFASGYPISIIDMRSRSSLGEALSEVDAVLIPGGADIDPRYYLSEVGPELQRYTQENLGLVKFSSEGKFRDQYEFDLVKKYSSDETYRELPMLGICRGMQMMTVAQGIPLYLDIKTELGIPNRKGIFDTIYVKRDGKASRMLSMFGDRPIYGFKMHHQGLRVPYYKEHQSQYPQVKITSYSHQEQIAESIEYLHRPALGVQYHPEKSLGQAAQPVFEWLFNKACEYHYKKDTL